VSDPDTVAAHQFAAEAKFAFRFLRDELGFDGPSVDYPSFAVWVTLESTGYLRQGDTHRRPD
jgi:hypothetical protein